MLWIKSCLLIVLIPTLTSAFIEPITATIGIAGAGLFSGYHFVRCRFWECCDEKWIHYSVPELHKLLTKHLYGQHLVIDIVVNAIKAHHEDKDSQKPLVLSFHGWTGSGKNYVAKLIAKALFKAGESSKFVHWFVGTSDFEDDEMSKNKDKIRTKLVNIASICPHALFIFDEVDKMKPELLDSVAAFLDHHQSVAGADFRKSIFLFLSNTGGMEIASKALDLWNKSYQREDLKHHDIEKLIEKGAFNEEGGLRHGRVIQKNVIDHYVPFLPLEHKHVKLCVKDVLEKQGHSRDINEEEVTNAVFEALSWSPDEEGIYSKSGCKKVASEVRIYLQRKKDQ